MYVNSKQRMYNPKTKLVHQCSGRFWLMTGVRQDAETCAAAGLVLLSNSKMLKQ